jgi:hypothetical protein
MRFPSPSVSNNRWAKDLLKPFMTAESEDATAEIFDRDEWVDFGSINKSGEFRGIVGEKEVIFHGGGSDVACTLYDRELFWLKHAENRDELSSNCEFDEFDKADDESREQLESVSQPRARVVPKRHPSNHPMRTVVQKWEAIIRSNHGVENTGKRIEFDGTDENISRLHKTRSVGGLTSNSISPKPTRARRSFGLRDITNSLNPQLSNSSISMDGRTDFSHTNKSTFRVPSRRSISDGVTNCSNTTEPTKQRRSFGLGEIMPSSAPVNPPDATVHSITSKPTRGRRSFGLSDFNANFNTLSSTNNTKQITTVILKPTTHDIISREKASHSVRKSDPVTRQSLQTSRNNSNDGDNSYDSKSSEKQTATSSDSDDSEFKRLLNLWNHQIEDEEIHNFCSPAQNQKSHSRVSAVEGDAIKISSNGSEDSRLNSTAARNAPKYSISNGLIDSDNYEENNSNRDKKAMRVLVILEQGNKCDLIVGESRQNDEGEEQLVIQKNRTLKTEGIECECSRSAFSGNEDLISFFLPQMGMACVCGRNRNEYTNPNDPTALGNILRPWQVEFLKSCFDIHRGEQLVKCRRRSAGIMARGLRQWRKKNGMVSFKTSSCATALHIWSKVCKSYVRSIRRQTLAGKEDLQLGPADAALFSEMSQFLGDLPAAPKRRYRASNDVLGIEPESQVEV